MGKLLKKKGWTPDQVHEQFNSVLGRDASESELQFLQPYLQHQQITPYEIGQYLGSTPEAQSSRLNKYGEQYGNMLAQNDQTIMGRAGDEINSQFARQGRQGSTGQSNALLQVGQNLAMDRNSALSAFYGQGYQGLMGQYGQGQSALQRAYGMKDANQARTWAVQDFNMQKDASLDAMNTQNRQNLQTGLATAPITLLGSALGAYGMFKGMQGMAGAGGTRAAGGSGIFGGGGANLGMPGGGDSFYSGSMRAG